MKNKNVVFFDLDGTLVKTEKAHYMAYSAAMFSMNLLITNRSTFNKYAALGRDILRKEYFKGIYKLKNKDIAEIFELKTRALATTLPLYAEPNVELIKKLKRYKMEGYTIAIVTNAQRKNAELILNYLGIYFHVDLIISSNDVIKCKPDSESYLKAIYETSADLTSENVIAYEDNEIGIEAAEKAGIKNIIEVIF